MSRFFMAGANMAGGVAVITGADAEHIRVLRLRLGEKLVVCDGSGTDHHCHISRLGTDFAEVTLEKSVPSPAEASVRVTVLCGIPKGDKAETIIQKCTENGAAEIVFFPCERCVSRPDARSMEKKLVRWQKIAEEAAKQSGRGIIPQVRAVEDFASALNEAKQCDLGLFLYETGEREGLRGVLQSAGDIRTCALITGPEGGFEKYEADLAKAAGLRVCAMGPRILRCETAPVVALSAVMYETGNL